MDDLKQIERSIAQRARRVKSADELQQLRAEVLGKKGVLAQALRNLRDLSAEERPRVGQLLHEAKGKVEAALDAAAARLQQHDEDLRLEAGRVDVTLPGRRVPSGAVHPLRIVQQDVINALAPLGFSVVEGPIVEHDWYNFEALNIPADHPARDMQDTFFLAPQVVLRTHTSNVQVRTLLRQKPPVRILAPGMVFRHDEVDATHSPVFHQIEGLWVDERVSFADLKGLLHRVAEQLFGAGTQIRLRPSFFPFTEPSAEVDVSCAVCAGRGDAGCRMCRGSGWLEILGAGMVDPAVLEAVGLDPEAVQGLAFGIGLERLALLRWGIDDIRLFYDNDLRFLRQFAPASRS